ncbi:MAG TPA: hypothetical protein DCL54_09650 [Alphaproteobacteria bacterium]|nr:hypothetical protein [Alphaproteobacteria bacterium]
MISEKVRKAANICPAQKLQWRQIMAIAPSNPLAANVQRPVSDAAPKGPAAEAPTEDFSFEDFLDIVNPLQHIPLVNLLYREITGDTIKPPATIFGGAIFGGPLGFVGAIVTAAIEEATGDTPLGHLTAMLKTEQPQIAARSYVRMSALQRDALDPPISNASLL